MGNTEPADMVEAKHNILSSLTPNSDLEVLASTGEAQTLGYRMSDQQWENSEKYLRMISLDPLP